MGISCKLAIMLVLTSAIANAAGVLDVFDRNWTVPEASDWRVDTEEGVPVLCLLKGREPLASGPRRPFQFALTELPNYGRLTVLVDAKPLARSVLIVFGYRDPAHFDYAHLSRDTGVAQHQHNGVFHVYGGERVRISAERGPAAFAAGDRWYHVKLVHNALTGTVAVWVDGRAVPALKAVDVSLGAGKMGLGSFDETSCFRNLKIQVSGSAAGQ